MIEKAIFDTLRNHAGLSAIIGQRIFPVVLPQNGTFPAITYQISGTDPENDLDGYTGLNNLRVQLVCWAESYLEATNVSKQAALAMESATTFDAIRTRRRDHPYDLSTYLYQVTLDFSVWHTE